jgi:hypothetical protein
VEIIFRSIRSNLSNARNCKFSCVALAPAG